LEASFKVEKFYRTFENVRMDYHGISNELALSCAVHAANETLGLEGIVPVTLVFGIVPGVGTKLPNQPERVKAMMAARHEMRNIMEILRVTRALRTSVPPATDIEFVPGDQVLVFREDPEVFTSPFTVDNVIAKTVYVRTSKGDIKPFSCAQFKHFKTTPDLLETSNKLVTGASSENFQNLKKHT
jgi:hypothetical protein